MDNAERQELRVHLTAEETRQLQAYAEAHGVSVESAVKSALRAIGMIGPAGARTPEQTPITTAQAGRLGALIAREKHGIEHYVRAGVAGGEATSRAHGSEHYQRLGKAGGEATKARHGVDAFRELAERAGAATKAKYGPDYYRELGRKSAAARWGKAKGDA